MEDLRVVMVKVTVTSRFRAMNSHANYGFSLVVISQCSAEVLLAII